MHELKGVNCNLQATAIEEIRLENLNPSGILDAGALLQAPKSASSKLSKESHQRKHPLLNMLLHKADLFKSKQQSSEWKVAYG